MLLTTALSEWGLYHLTLRVENSFHLWTLHIYHTAVELLVGLLYLLFLKSLPTAAASSRHFSLLLKRNFVVETLKSSILEVLLTNSPSDLWVAAQ